MRRIYVDKYTGKIERTDLYLVRLTLKDGTVYEDLEPRRLFPYTNHTMYITLLDKDERELGFVRDFEEIDEDSRKALAECFEEYYMIPKITHIISCKDEAGSLKWTVDTDRGEVTFTVKNRHSDIKYLHGTNRIIIRDSNDNRYEIENIDNLDKHSNKVIFAYL